MNENKPKDILVAVYGSLKEGYPNHRLLSASSSPLVGAGLTVDKFAMRSFTAFPGLIEIEPDKPEAANVEVEVYLVDSSTFSRLDGLEGYPSFYNRKEVGIKLEDGSEVTAWIYILSDKYSDENLIMPNTDGILSW